MYQTVYHLPKVYAQVLVNRLEDWACPGKGVIWLTDQLNMTLTLLIGPLKTPNSTQETAYQSLSDRIAIWKFSNIPEDLLRSIWWKILG